MSRRLIALLLALPFCGCMRSPVPAVSGSGGQAPPASNPPAAAIDSKYFAAGPWQVTADIAFACCDSTGNAYDIWYPADIGRGGFRHPVITWGNGSDAVPSQYAYLLDHLASWGFVVIATELDATHTGEEITDAARYLMAENENPASRFYRKIAPGKAGAIGHSQGSGGVLNALRNHPDVIGTVIAIERPPQYFCAPDDCPSTSGINAGSVFFINGSADVVISPSTQAGPCMLAGMANEQSNQCLYENLPDALPKLWATLIGTDHNDVQGQPDCPSPPGLCAQGVYGFLGYPTAWMMDQLQGDASAHNAFISDSGEIFQSSKWINQISNIR